jgi:hypothetical protein
MNDFSSDSEEHILFPPQKVALIATPKVHFNAIPDLSAVLQILLLKFVFNGKKLLAAMPSVALLALMIPTSAY